MYIDTITRDVRVLFKYIHFYLTAYMANNADWWRNIYMNTLNQRYRKQLKKAVLTNIRFVYWTKC